MIVGVLIDADALWHAALYAFCGAMVFIGAFALAIYGRDRAARDGSSSVKAIAWNAVAVVGLSGCISVFALGIWAMTQKPG